MVTDRYPLLETRSLGSISKKDVIAFTDKTMIRRVLDTLPGASKFVLNGTDRPFGDHSGAKEMVTSASTMCGATRGVAVATY